MDSKNLCRHSLDDCPRPAFNGLSARIGFLSKGLSRSSTKFISLLPNCFYWAVWTSNLSVELLDYVEELANDLRLVRTTRPLFTILTWIGQDFTGTSIHSAVQDWKVPWFTGYRWYYNFRTRENWPWWLRVAYIDFVCFPCMRWFFVHCIIHFSMK
jgi:hypothetical protein